HEDLVLSLAAKQGGQTLQTVPVRVHILRSDTPIGTVAFTNDKFLELQEDCCRAGSPILQARVNVSHDDFRIKYHLTTGGGHLVPSDDQFRLDPDTGLLHLKRPLDFERKHEHRVNITAVIGYDDSPKSSI